MKSVFTKKIVALSLLTVLVCGFLVAPVAQAATAGETITDTVSGVAAKPIFGAITVSAFIVNGVFSGMAAVTGVLFDKAVKFSVVNIKTFFDNTGIVNTLWTFIRDLVNISFIFILLYLAITKIMGSWGVQQKTTVVNVIISAIFINFSMMIAKLFIDAGNVVAVELYKAIAGSDLQASISTLFMRNTDLSNLITDWKLTSQLQTITNLVLNIGALGWLIYLFFYCSILFIGRAVMLLFLVISSPIAFMGKTIPFLSGLSKTWWETLTDQIILAPLVMFLLYVTLKVTQRMNFSDINLNNSGTALENVGKFFAFILVLVLLSQTIKIAKKYSGEVGKIAVQAAKGAAVAAAVVVGAVATGGVSLAAGASTLAGAAGAGADAAAAGKTGLAALGARLQFSGKQLADSKIGKSVTGAFNTVGKFAKGEYEERPGILGAAGRKVRGTFMNFTNEATGGKIDLKKIQDDLRKEQSRKANEETRKEREGKAERERLEKQKETVDKSVIGKTIEDMGPGFVTQLKTTKANVDQAKEDLDIAKEKLRDAKKQGWGIKLAQDDFNDKETKLKLAQKDADSIDLDAYKKAVKDHTQNMAEFDSAKINLDRANKSGNTIEKQIATSEYKDKLKQFTDAENKLKDFNKDLVNNYKENFDGLAKAMGTSFGKMNDDIAKSETKRLQSIEGREILAAKLQAPGVKGLVTRVSDYGVSTVEESDRIAYRLRQGTGGDKTAEQLLKDAITKLQPPTK